MKTWNNEVKQKGDTPIDWWHDILDNVKEGDKVYNGVGALYICEYASSDKEQNEDKNNYVQLHFAKQDGTMHKGFRHESHVFSVKYNCWDF